MRARGVAAAPQRRPVGPRTYVSYSPRPPTTHRRTRGVLANRADGRSGQDRLGVASREGWAPAALDRSRRRATGIDRVGCATESVVAAARPAGRAYVGL